MRDLTRISRRLSFILRHHPEKFGISLDPEGWATLEEIESKTGITREEITRVIETQDKRRFELEGDRIRALYGHSSVKVSYPPAEPPPVLYHGTTRERAQMILKEGLRPMERFYVHLSTSEEEARRVSERYSQDTVVLKVRAMEAFEAGVEFFKAGDVFLSPLVPPDFLEVAETTP